MLVAVQTKLEEDPSVRKVVYLKAQAVLNFKGSTIKRWPKRRLTRTSTVMIDDISSMNGMGEVVEAHQPTVMVRGLAQLPAPGL